MGKNGWFPDESMAEGMAQLLYESLVSSDRKGDWKDKPYGEKVLLQYSSFIFQKGRHGPIDWENLDKNADIIRSVVVLTRSSEIQQGTAILAVSKVVKMLGLEDNDLLSIERQAYKLRAMLSHLRRIFRHLAKVESPRGFEKVVAIAKLLEPLPAKTKTKKNQPAKEEQQVKPEVEDGQPPVKMKVQMKVEALKAVKEEPQPELEGVEAKWWWHAPVKVGAEGIKAKADQRTPVKVKVEGLKAKADQDTPIKEFRDVGASSRKPSRRRFAMTEAAAAEAAGDHVKIEGDEDDEKHKQAKRRRRTVAEAWACIV